MKTNLFTLPILLALTLAPADAAVRYVNLANPSPAPPYTDWASAATNIQDAIDAADAGDEIVVTNGVYATGEREGNRVTIYEGLAMRSVNGPEVTVIDGSGFVRCVDVSGESTLSGFTLTNGLAVDGGGVWCRSRGAIVSNCVMTGNSAQIYGGGAYGGTLNNCVLTSNSANLGGGAAASTLINCILTGNSAFRGGGVFVGVLINCTVTRNSAGESGGGVGMHRVTQGDGEGIWAWNCIIYYNEGGNYFDSPFSPLYLTYCCTMPQPPDWRSGNGNSTNAPQFIDPERSDFHLQSNSPCINSGLNALAPPGADLDGLPRIVGGTVDMGAYEFQSPQSLISYVWLQQFGLPTDGTVDNLDFDGDRLNNWQEWRAGTDPTNALSTLRLFTLERSGADLVVRWASVLGKTYFLQRSSELASGTNFTPLAQNIPSQGDSTTYTDPTVATNGVHYFYRVGVE